MVNLMEKINSVGVEFMDIVIEWCDIIGDGLFFKEVVMVVVIKG